MSIRVKEVRPLQDMCLAVYFENSVTKIYDVKQLLGQFPVYEKLKNDALFNTVQVDCGGCAVAWDEETDISEVELWEGGVVPSDTSPARDEIEAIEQAEEDINNGDVFDLASITW